MGRRLHCVSRLACCVQSYMKHEGSQEVSVFRLRIKIEKRPDAAPISSVEFLREAVVVVLLTAVVAFTVLASHGGLVLFVGRGWQTWPQL